MGKEELRADLKDLKQHFKLMQNSHYFELRIYSFEEDMNILRERLKHIYEKCKRIQKDRKTFLETYQRLQKQYEENLPFLHNCRQEYRKSYHKRNLHENIAENEEYKFIHPPPQSFDYFLQKHSSILQYRLRDASELQIGGTYFGVCKRWYWGHKYNVPLFKLQRIEYYKSTSKNPLFLVGSRMNNDETLQECFLDNFWYRIGNADDEPLSSDHAPSPAEAAAAAAATRAKLRDWYYSIIYDRYRHKLQTRREREYSSNTPLHFGGTRNTQKRRRKKFYGFRFF